MSDSDSGSDNVIRTRSQKKAYGEIVLQRVVEFYEGYNRVPVHGSSRYEDSLADFIDEFNKPEPFCFSASHKALLLQVHPWLDPTKSEAESEYEDESEVDEQQTCDETSCCCATDVPVTVVVDSRPWLVRNPCTGFTVFLVYASFVYYLGTLLRNQPVEYIHRFM
jgi:hypothetical protein